MNPRRSQQRKRDERRAMRRLEAELTNLQGQYIPPNREQCEMRGLPSFAMEFERLRARGYTWRQGGRLVEFTVLIEILEDGVWRTCYDIDCKHGHVHYHLTGPDLQRGPGQHIYKLDDVAGVAYGLNAALAHADQYFQQKLIELGWEES